MSVASTAAPRPGPAPAPTPDVPGFEIGLLLGSGGMGRVYRARDVESGREVALKWLDANAGDELRNRFQREAKAASGLRHPNIVGVFGSGRTNTGDFIVMELVEGFPLSIAFDARALGAAAVAEVGAKVARALEAAHAAGVVHRDVKPGNILLDAASQPKLVDFGLARFVSEKNALTGPQAIMGTLAYMSPEVARGGAADAGPASDVFSLGCVLYEGLAGAPPFLGERVQDTLRLLEQSSPAPLPALVPPAVAALVLEALAKKPAQRPTARAVAERLEALSVPIASMATPAVPRSTDLLGLATRPLSQASAPPVLRSTAGAPGGSLPATRAAGTPVPATRPVSSRAPATRPAPEAKPAPTDSPLPQPSEGRQAMLLVGGLFLALAFASLLAFAWGRRPASLPVAELEAIASPSPAPSAPSTEPAPVKSVPSPAATPAPVAIEPSAPDAADELAGLDLMPAEPETMPSPAPSPSPVVAPSGNATPAPRPTPNVIEEDLKALRQSAMAGEHETTVRLANKLLVEVPASEKVLVAQVYAALGRAEVFVGTTSEAEQAYTRALDRDPDNLNALYGHVALALLEKSSDLAQKRLKALTDRKPGSTAAMTAKAMIQAAGAGRPGTRLLESPACFDKPLTRHTLRVASGKR